MWYDTMENGASSYKTLIKEKEVSFDTKFHVEAQVNFSVNR